MRVRRRPPSPDDLDWVATCALDTGDLHHLRSIDHRKPSVVKEEQLETETYGDGGGVNISLLDQKPNCRTMMMGMKEEKHEMDSNGNRGERAWEMEIINGIKSLKRKRKKEAVDGEGDVVDRDLNLEPSNLGEARRLLNTSITIEQLMDCEGKKLADACNHLHVSRHTFQTICRSYGIKRWNSNPGLKAPRSHNYVPTISQLPSIIEVKARVREKNLLFRITQPWNISDVRAEIDIRIAGWNVGPYDIHYKDSLGDIIVIAVNEDLLRYLNSQLSQGLKCINLEIIS